MRTFDENKIRRDGQGQFANKDASRDEAEVELGGDIEHRDHRGRLHRTDGPAVVPEFATEYWQEGNLHRDPAEGPATTERWEDGDFEQYWYNGHNVPAPGYTVTSERNNTRADFTMNPIGGSQYEVLRAEGGRTTRSEVTLVREPTPRGTGWQANSVVFTVENGRVRRYDLLDRISTFSEPYDNMHDAEFAAWLGAAQD